jgi:hypothetical protein
MSIRSGVPNSSDVFFPIQTPTPLFVSKSNETRHSSKISFLFSLPRLRRISLSLLFSHSLRRSSLDWRYREGQQGRQCSSAPSLLVGHSDHHRSSSLSLPLPLPPASSLSRPLILFTTFFILIDNSILQTSPLLFLRDKLPFCLSFFFSHKEFLRM